jgi:hypothetical protein
MPSVRLTDRIRDIILQRLMTRAFDETQHQLADEEALLAKDIHQDVYPEAVRKKMNALPDGYLEDNTSLRFSFAGQIADIQFRKLRIALSDERRVVKVYPADHHLCERHFELEKKNLEHRSRREHARRQAKAILDSCYTLKRLLEVWPDVAPVVVDFVASADATTEALSFPIKELNGLLGLETVPATKRAKS